MSEFESELWRDVYLHAMRSGHPHSGSLLAANDAVDAYRDKSNAASKPYKAPTKQGEIK